ncbi:MAG: CYTH domain-containing protein [Bacteroidaceae bacterium]|nr:CYTH domain-containing protein [Bacteroidaceae bacterium]
MAQEIERKFLVKGDAYRALAFHHYHIAQGYISSGNGRTVRVRIRDDQGFLTIKGPSADGGLSRYEFETEIAVSDAHDLMQLCEPGIIDKTRWLVKTADGHTFEVDEFHGDNDGLVMAEVELGAADETFEKPHFIGREVTGDRRFYNSHLRRYPFKLWKEDCPEP